MLNDSRSLSDSIKAIVELWKTRIVNQKALKDEWKQFMTNSRRLIQETTTIEEKFFPKIVNNTEDYNEIIRQYENKLNETQPLLKVSFNSFQFDFKYQTKN